MEGGREVVSQHLKPHDWCTNHPLKQNIVEQYIDKLKRGT